MIKDNIIAHEHMVVGIVVVTIIAGAFLLGLRAGFHYGLARCV